MEYDFSGWATRNNLMCSDGRVIMKDAFKHHDGQTVPLVWNHQHNSPDNVLGHAVLENREDGVYAYCSFNDSPMAQDAKSAVKHGDVVQLSIYANRLKQRGSEVIHGMLREVSLVLAGANPGAYIEHVLAHGDDSEEAAVIYTGDLPDNITMFHAEEQQQEEEEVEEETEMDNEQTIQHAEDAQPEDKKTEGGEKSIQEVIDSMTEEQKSVMYGLIGQALEEGEAKHNDSEGGTTMKHNVFDQEEIREDNYLSHADQESIIKMAKQSGVGSLQSAIGMYVEDTLSHADGELAPRFVDSEGADAIEWLFPEYKDLKPGAPELLTRDYGWVPTVMNGVHKSPIARVRTRQADARGLDLRSLGYKKGDKKAEMANIKLMKRTTDPQTVYIKDAMHRDDILDITDFDVVAYKYQIMRGLMDEEIALAVMVGDGREEGDEHKIDETKIRPIWLDDELYTIHHDVDIEAARAELQGTETNAHFGENYVYAEAIITAALYSREKYKGSGNLDFYCTPHLLNVMLLARDLNGRRIYDSKTDLAAALNVRNIHTVEQFEGKTRKTKDGDEKKLLGLFVNLADYQIGCVKGGEITKFQQFDIDFNQEKYLIETRISGALTRVFSAIALEEPVATTEG